jgi:hypothetical protein
MRVTMPPLDDVDLLDRYARRRRDRAAFLAGDAGAMRQGNAEMQSFANP